MKGATVSPIHVITGLDPVISQSLLSLPMEAMTKGVGVVHFIHVLHNSCTKGGWVYIMANRPDGTLYVGVTSDLARRVHEHKSGTAKGFTDRYQLMRLVYAEHHEEIQSAIQREKNIKHWPRAWKVDLIQVENSAWQDLYDKLI